MMIAHGSTGEVKTAAYIEKVITDPIEVEPPFSLFNDICKIAISYAGGRGKNIFRMIERKTNAPRGTHEGCNAHSIMGILK